MQPSRCGPEVRVCPISQGPCPGECVFAHVMEGQTLGVLVFDLAAPALLFANRAARALLEKDGRPVDYESMRALFLDGGDAARRFETVGRPEPLRLGSRLIGYTLYREGPFAWALVRDITAKARLESIAEAVESMNNIGYVFSAVRHELGNPVNSIKAALSVLRANVESYSRETVAEYLDRMGAELGRVENLLRSLKTFSLYERPEIRAVDLRALLDEGVSLREAKMLLGRHKIESTLRKTGGNITHAAREPTTQAHEKSTRKESDQHQPWRVSSQIRDSHGKCCCKRCSGDGGPSVKTAAFHVGIQRVQCEDLVQNKTAVPKDNQGLHKRAHIKNDGERH